MRKSLCIVLVCCLSAFSTQSFSKSKKGEGKESSTKAKIRGKEQVTTQQKKNLAKQLLSEIQTCADAAGCGLSTDYCNTNCKDIIRDCHKIEVDEFNILTDSGHNGRATFSRAKIENVLADAVCSTNWVRCYIHERGWPFSDLFRIGVQPDYDNDSLSYETYYSPPLLQAIYNMHDSTLVEITLYRGTKVINHETGEVQYLIPLMAMYDGDVIEYFDVSNDLP